jgi:hypothetical protein
MKLIAPAADTRIAIDHTYVAKPLLTLSEAKFHKYLEMVSQGRCRILIKPRLADVFQHEKGDLAGFNKISQKHVDFIICRNDDWTPMLAIELDDDSHQKRDRQNRDMFVNALFASTGIPLLRIDVREVDRIEPLVQNLTRAWERRWKTIEG